jgi:hypothetical protein
VESWRARLPLYALTVRVLRTVPDWSWRGVTCNHIQLLLSRRMSRSMCMQAHPRNLLEQVTQHSQVIADTADYEALQALPSSCLREVTTNPSILWDAAQKPQYFGLLEEASKVL